MHKDLYIMASPLQFTRQVKENQLGTNFSCSEYIYFWLKCSWFKIQIHLGGEGRQR